MGCGCVPYIVGTSGTCNQTYSMCQGGSVTIPINPVCSVLPIISGIPTANYTATVSAITVFGLTANTTFTYTCGARSCTITLIMQEANEGAHTITLNACGSQCTNGLPTSYEWSGFEDGCIQLHPDYSVYDCEIKVIVFDDANCSINLKACCGNCGDNCCKTTHWTWNAPSFNDNCVADCSMYPCTTYNPVTGNCEPICEECEICCVGSATTGTIVSSATTFLFGVRLNDDTIIPTGLMLPVIAANIAAYENALNNAVNSNGHFEFVVSTLYPNNFLLKYETSGSPMEYIILQQIANPGISTLITVNEVTQSYCAECCDNSGCQLENCLHQPICQAGECNCYINGELVDPLPSGCCPSTCTDLMVLPPCWSCLEGELVPPVVCTGGRVLNTTTCTCACPSGTTWNPITETCQPIVGNCITNPSLCGECEQCNAQGVCVAIDCSTSGTVNNPNSGDCCIPDPCPQCTNGVDLMRVCVDILPKKAAVVVNANYYNIKFSQIAAPLFTATNCSYDYLNTLPNILESLPGAVYAINYTNYIGDWQPISANLSNSLNILKTNGNGFLLKCSWNGREVVYEFIFEDGATGSAVNNELISIKQVYTSNCSQIYKLVSPCIASNIEWTGNIIYQNNSGLVIVTPNENNQSLCVSMSVTSNGVVCNDIVKCILLPLCTGGCGCEICPPVNGSSIETTITEVGENKYYASIFRHCPNNIDAPLMFTCAPPTETEYDQYLLNNTLPNFCGTLPQMALTKPSCSNCATFTCSTSMCGWWVDTTKLVANSLNINGANIEFEVLPGATNVELCFGANTECGYTCTCTAIEAPEPPAQFDMQCDVIYRSTLMQGINHQPAGINEFTLPISNTMICDGLINIILDYSFELQMDRLEVFYNNVLVAATPYVGAICNALPTNPITYILPCNGITSTNITAPGATLCYDCGWYENTNLLPSNINNNQGQCNSAPPNWGALSPAYTFASGTNYAGQGRLRIVVPYNGTTNELKIKVHNNPDEEPNASSDQGTGAGVTQLCNHNGASVTDWSIKALCTTCEPASCPPPALESISNDCDEVVGHFNIVTPCSTGTIQYSYSTNSTEIEANVIWSAWTPTLPTWEDGLWLKARCADNEDCTSISSNIVFADHVNCDCDLHTYITNTCLPGFSSGTHTITDITIHITGGTGPYTITSEVQLFNGSNLITIVNEHTETSITGPTYNILGIIGAVSLQVNQYVQVTYTVTDSTGTCTTTVEDFIVLCPNEDPTYDCVNGNCEMASGDSGQYASLQLCQENCIGAIAKLCDDVVTVTNTPSHTSIFTYDLTNYQANNVYYLDAAFGGKPEKYKIYQVNSFNVKTLIAETPYLGCGCSIDGGKKKALSGFWTNVDGLTQSGAYDDTTVADGNTPFEFAITALFYGALNYNTYVSGGLNMGYTYDFIPSNSDWTDYYDNDCYLIAGADYTPCGTCTPLTYEEVNATGLGRIYFKYLPSFGTLLQVEVEHGILNTTCPPYNTYNQHGVKFAISCTDEIQELCEPVTGNIVGEEPANPPLFSRYEYTPVCVGEYNPVINLTQSRAPIPVTNTFAGYESIPFFGATNVAVGLKTVKGKTTDTVAYIYQVKNKLPLSKIKKANRIPKEINGIPTDVVELRESVPFYNHLSAVSNRLTYNNGGLTPSSSFTPCGLNSTCYDNTYDTNGGPYCGCAPDLASISYSGLPSISHNLAYNSNSTVYGGVGVFTGIGNVTFSRGTMGIIAKETSTGKLVGITNNHVISTPGQIPTYGAVEELIDTNNSMVYRLGANFVYDTYPNCYLSTGAVWGTHFGTDYRVVAQVVTPQVDADLGNYIYNYVDAGLIAIQPDFAATDIHEIGQGYFPWVRKGTGIHDDFSNYADLIGKPVYKSGATTGTKILIGHIEVANSHQYQSIESGGEVHLQDQIVITPTSNSLTCSNIISMGGDSGSPILVEFDNQLKLIGILWGGNQLQNANYSVICPIWRIAEIAGVEEWDGTIIVNSNSPYIQLTKNERVYQIGQATSSPVTHTTFTELSTLPETPCN
ncbi:MAG TPA: hypothetical protein PKD00_01770 [Burkholderiales bacterium]|nr:hypothetical protein [Burkholderiales bacterium]